MAIDVRWGADPTVLASLSQAVGQSGRARQVEQQEREDAKFLLGLRQNDAQFQAQMDLRALDSARQGQRFYDGQAFDAQRQAANVAAQQEAQFSRQQYDLQADAQNFDQQAALMDFQAQQAYGRDNVASMEAGVKDELKQLRQMNLDPEGKRKLAELSSDYNAIQAQRGLTLRPEQYATVLGQWYDKLSSADLSQYEVKEPTAEETFRKGLVPMQGQQIGDGPLPPGKYKFVDGVRNGVPSYSDYDVAPPAEEISAQEKYNNRRAITGFGTEVYFDDKGVPHEFKPEKSASQGSTPAKLTLKDKTAAYAAVTKMLLDQYEAEHPATRVDAKGNEVTNDRPSFGDYKKKHMKSAIEEMNQSFGGEEEEQEESAELPPPLIDPSMADLHLPPPVPRQSPGPQYPGTEAPAPVADEQLTSEGIPVQMQPGEEIITSPSGVRGVRHADGTVTVLDN